jgi:murein endopeptidase
VTPTTPVTPTKPPKVETNPAPATEVSGNRPLDQAWGKPHTGQVVNGKRVYLTNSTSLLEVFQKLGPDNGFSVWRPQKLRHYGTYDIVEMIVNIGEWIKENVPGFDMKVNDISAKTGGMIGHSSHKTGMDVDLAYITKSPKMTFMDLDRVKGSYTHADFDGANQWKLIKATFDMSPVEVIYVNRKIKNEMCRQALIAGDLKSNTDTKSEAASILTRLVVIDSNHGDHWHVRMDCNYLRNTLKVQRKCVPHPQQFVGPECQRVSLK